MGSNRPGLRGGKRSKASKASKGGKARRPSAISRRKKRTTPKRRTPTPLTDEARVFLHECPGGMDTNEKRDTFLKAALKSEQFGHPSEDVVRNIVRAALFQGRAVERDHADSALQRRTRKRGKKRGPLDMGDQHVLRVLAQHIGKQIFERLGSPNDDEDFHSNLLAPNIEELSDQFDCTGEEHDLWDMELHQLASDILDRVLERTRERLEVLMGASAWQTMGLPQF